MNEMGLIIEGLDAYRSGGSLVWVPHDLDILATAFEVAGKFEEAVKQVNNALQIVDKTGERWFAAELNRHKGQLLARQGIVEAAEDRFYEALTMAQTQDARLWELRAILSLARLRLTEGRVEQATENKEPVSRIGPVVDPTNFRFGTLDELRDQPAAAVRRIPIHPAELSIIHKRDAAAPG